MSNNSFYEFWLTNIEGIGAKKQKRILEYGDLQALFEMDAIQLATELAQLGGLSDRDIMNICLSRDYEKVSKEWESVNRDGICFLGVSDEHYPDNLRYIYDAPVGLYYRGNLDKLNSVQKRVAIVGSRGCTQYGIRIASDLAHKLSEAGVSVISGMAHGIDTYAHRGCLEGNSPTYAVLAGGVDICYPKDNINLYYDICREGGIFSEFPLGKQPLPQLFPVRNRIISGMADAVIVVEARLKSGSLITADMALEQGRNIYVVPGRIGDPLSEGCLWLAKQGAQIITDARTVLQDLGMESAMDSQEKLLEENFKIALAPHEKMLYSLMCLFPKKLNTIIEESGLEPDKVMSALLNLELKGLIREVGCNYYSKK